jgi:SAM-dependent methyltransferase
MKAGISFYCPRCKNPLAVSGKQYRCQDCSSVYQVAEGIPQFISQDLPVDSFDVDAFKFLFEMEKKHFWHTGRKEIILSVLKGVPDIGSARMLEIGCGNGNVLSFLKAHGIDIEGGDIFLEGLKFCRQNTAGVPLYQIDILALPFQNEFDVIGLFDVLEHIENDERALGEVNSALKTHGKILLTVPAHKYLWSSWDEVSMHRRRYDRKEIISKLERNGFTILKASYYISFLFPLFLAVRILSKMRRSKNLTETTQSVEVQTIPLINTLLLWTIRFEKKLLKYCNLPLGASLLILAQKN